MLEIFWHLYYLAIILYSRYVSRSIHLSGTQTELVALAGL